MPTFELDKCVLAELQDLVRHARAKLLSGPTSPVAYPEDRGPDDWDADEISRMNEDLLRDLAGAGNVYAIFVGEGEEWLARYVGQRKREKLGARLRQHLVKAHKRTGSKLEKVQAAVRDGKRIGISYVLIEPEPLRHYVEESIIAGRMAGELRWNSHQ